MSFLYAKNSYDHVIESLFCMISEKFFTSDTKTKNKIYEDTNKNEKIFKREFSLNDANYKLGLITFLKIVHRLTLEDRIAIGNKLLELLGIKGLYTQPKQITPEAILEEMSLDEPVGKAYVSDITEKSPKLKKKICNEKRTKK